MANDTATTADWVQQALNDYERPLIQFAYRLTGNRETARDVVQDTFVKLCSAEPAKLNGRLAPWLFTVCRNRAYDVGRQQAREKAYGNGHADAPDSAPAPNVFAERHESMRIVVETLAKLPKKQRQVFKLKFDRGMTYREISAETGMGLATVSSHLHAAMKNIRAALEPQPEPQEATSHESQS
jgi:RNA polymerase sigma-70 factor (ECF subfamily)